MPAYNAERFIAKAIESILAQTFNDFELIIINDGSTDSTAAIIARYAEQDTRIRWCSRDNRGIVATRREMLEMSQGRYIALLDSDDIALPGRLEKTIAYLEAHQDCLAVGGAIEVIDSDGDPLCTWHPPREHQAIEACLMGTQDDLFMAASTSTIRKEWIHRVGGYDPASISSAEDLDLMIRLCERGRLANLSEPLAQYRLHFQNESMAQRRRQQEARNRIVNDSLIRRGLHPADALAKPSAQESRVQTHVKWTWWALAAGHTRSAAKHGWLAVRRAPWSKDAWRAYGCAVRANCCRIREPS